ncbi:hypothetical protein TFLX_06239 [Thermoflexales bacterium]|nr:hypothetical protein TFLX_06239 [Thermoflexales bacterium]
MAGLVPLRHVVLARTIWHQLREKLTFEVEAFKIVVALRVGFILLAVLAWVLYPKDLSGVFSDFALPDFPVWHNRLLGMWGTWDASWYMQIADQGYLADTNSLAFFPLYPLLVSLVGRLLGNSYLLAGLLISTVLAWASLVLLHRLVTFDFQPHLARRAVLYLCAFPVAFYLFAIYTEALYLVLVLLFFLMIRQRHQWWWAGLLAALAALTRSPGVLLIIPFAWEWSRYQLSTVVLQPGTDTSFLWKAKLRALLKPSALALALPLLVLLGWNVYQQLVLNVPADALLQAQAHWQRSFAWPWTTIVDGLRVFFSPGPAGLPIFSISWDMPKHLLDAVFLVLGLVSLAYACWECWRRRLPFSYLLFMGTNILLPLLTPVRHEPVQSFPRFILVIFPIFILLAQLSLRSRWWYYFSICTSVALQALLLARFANGFWVA